MQIARVFEAGPLYECEGCSYTLDRYLHGESVQLLTAVEWCY